MTFYRVYDPSIEHFMYFKIERKENKENPYQNPIFTFYMAINDTWVECPVQNKSLTTNQSQNFLYRKVSSIVTPGDGHLQLEYIRKSELYQKTERGLAFNECHGGRIYKKLEDIEISRYDLPETLQKAEMRQMHI